MRIVVFGVSGLALLAIVNGVGCGEGSSNSSGGHLDGSADGVASSGSASSGSASSGSASSGSASSGSTSSGSASGGSTSSGSASGGSTSGGSASSGSASSGSTSSGSGSSSDGGGGITFSTDFPTVENPISQGGRFITATTPGVKWSVMVGGCGCKPAAPVAVTSPGLAQSPDIGNNVGDALAVLTGTWGADQTASAVVANLPASANGYEEIELHLRVDPTTGRGYEITWGYNHNYILIVTWNGPSGYTELVNQSAPQYAISPGDTVGASIRGSVITMSINSKMIYQYTDSSSSFTTGNPGFGLNEGPAGNYGISSFAASSP
jgi:hypothetical protein